MRNDKFLLLFSLILLFMISLSAVSASDNFIINNSSHIGESDNSFVSSYSSLKYSLGDNNNDYDDGINLNSLAIDNSNIKDNSDSHADLNLTIDDDINDSSNKGHVLKSSINAQDEDIDFSNRSNSIFHVNPDNFSTFFDENNELRMIYGGCTLIFEGNFTDLGVIDIKYPYTRITAGDNLFNNTAFRISDSNVELTNLNICLDNEFLDNDNAGILVLSDNVSIFNIAMNYTVPNSTTGFMIYAEGSDDDRIENFSLINSTFGFYGNNLDKGWDYGIFLDKTVNSLIYGNAIDSYLPLRKVDWSYDIFGGVSMDAVATIAVQGSDYLRMSNNTINSYVTCGGNEFPTLDACIFYDCKNLTIDQNDIYMEDIDSKNNKNNYLYGLDFYLCDDTIIAQNDIQVFTTGGRVGDGTAYPIQVNGPANDMKIAFNNLTTFNYGPNCGIYSHNFYGDTHIDIISNFINVTGLAGKDPWALVTGIEVQDSDDLVWNNTIIVTNLGNYSNDNNVYGVSYTQFTGGNHSYNIQYNNITTNGHYAVDLVGNNSLVVDTLVVNNVLNTEVGSGDKAVHVGGNKKNVTIRNNDDTTFKNVFDDSRYPEWLKNFLANNNVEAQDFKWITDAMNNASNGTGFGNGTGNNSGLVDDGGNETIGNNTNGTESLIDGNETGNGTGNGTEGNSTDLTPGGESGENNTDTNSTDNSTSPTNPTNLTNPDPINNTNPKPANDTDSKPVNNTDPEPMNNTDPKPVNNTDPMPEVPVEPINSTDPEPVNNTEPVNQTNATEPVNTTEPANQTNATEIIDNNTNQTIMEDDDLDPKESHDNNQDDKQSPSDDENSNPGDSGAELIDSENPSDSQDSEENQEDFNEENKDSEDTSNPSSPTVGDSHSDSASSPGLSGASAANDAYELDKKVEDVITKSVDYVSLAGICIVALLLILVGYKRQKDIEEED